MNASKMLMLSTVLCLLAPPLMARDTFRTHCKGGQEVPPVETRGQCQANFKVTRDGSGLVYRLNVANLSSAVWAAHIHKAPAGQNGPVVATLFMFGPGVESDGYLTDGVLGDDDINGEVETVEELVAAIEAGETYVNVHTLNVPSGEVRGQIE